MILTFKDNIFVVRCIFAERDFVRSLGFTWSEENKYWFTSDPYIAYLLYDDADAYTKTQLSHIRSNIQLSYADYPVFGSGDNFYYSFQAAGVEAACAQLRAGRKAVLVADEQGLGKTPESLQIANEMGYKNLLVICPASLRLNWQAEIAKWHYRKASDVVVTGRHKVNKSKSMVVSYSLANIAKDYQPDVIICDEVHALKNVTTKRTRLILGTNFFQPNSKRVGLVEKAPVILLTGTPSPNGRPNELWPLLARLAPEVIEPYLTQWAFIRRFCIWEQDPRTDILRILGAKNLPELYVRLRGSGFMIRRLKKDVLKSLPPKRYKLVVFPENAETKNVIEREKNFSAEEILAHGVPVGSVMPTLRREMGIAKIPQCLEYVRDYLEGGGEKVVLFAHHVEVVGLLVEGLRDFGVVAITGRTSLPERQKAVEQFQTNPAVRVFIGNEAAEEGWTLTAAHDVMLVEPEWVPGKNDQRADRLHRIGQIGVVIVHILVVEGSLDAIILGRAADKAENIELILGKGGG